MAKFPHVSKFALKKLLHLAFWDKYNPHPLPLIIKNHAFLKVSRGKTTLPKVFWPSKILVHTEAQTDITNITNYGFISPFGYDTYYSFSTSNNIRYCKKVKYFHFILSHFLSNLIDVIKRNKLISSYFQFR